MYTHFEFGRLFLALLILAFAQAARTHSDLADAAKVTLVVSDGVGSRVADSRVVLFKNEQSGVDFGESFREDRFHSLAAEHIPYGRYQLRVRKSGIPDAERELIVSANEITAKVSLKSADLTVKLVDGFGHILEREPQVESFTDVGNPFFPNMASRFTQGNARSVPYGTYSITVEFAGIRTRRTLDVFEPRVLAVLGVEARIDAVESGEPDGPYLSGEITNIPSDVETLRIRLVGEFMEYLSDADVKVSKGVGKFRLTGPAPAGRYFLVLWSGTRILKTMTVQVPSHSDLSIDLTSPDSASAK